MGLEELLAPARAPISLWGMILSLGLGIGLSLVLSWHYRRYARCLSNRADLARIFPLVILTTALIITIVKSSLALSLGLVGALSIVRFRTPIKEPEELAYLFLAIAIGLGLGAGQLLAVLVASAVILGALAWLRRGDRARGEGGVFLSVAWQGSEAGPEALDRLRDSLAKYSDAVDLRRVDVNDDGLDLTIRLDAPRGAALTPLLAELRSSFPGVDLTLTDPVEVPAA